jgi:4-amino-4-deoxy-L-arabinose transferase-like glycosyltransferase
MALLLAVALFTRLWNFSGTFQFLGDQGRDAIVVKHLIKDADPILIGPVTSTGNMYLGPLYYYAMAPFLWLTYPSPLGPAYAVAVLSIITIWLMFRIGKAMFGEPTALIATAFLTISAAIIAYSRFSWNPNPEPFFGLLLIWTVWKAKQSSAWWWILTAVWISILIQLHYVTLLTLPATGVIWLWDVVGTWQQHNWPRLRQLFLSLVLGAVIFVAFLSPLILFDLRHQGINWKSFQNFMFQDDGALVSSATKADRLLKSIRELHGRSLQALFEPHLGQHRTTNTLLLVGVIVGMLVLLFRGKTKNPHLLGHQILAIFFMTSVSGLALFRGSVYIHYLAYLFPISFFMIASVLTLLWEKLWGKPLVLLFLGGFITWNVAHWPLQSLGWQVSDMERVSKSIRERVKPGEKYNIVLLSETHDLYGQNYRYFLEVTDAPPVKTDDFAQAQKLFIINEQHLPGNITTLPIYEIQVFPHKIPSEVYTVERGPEVTVLENRTK